MPYKAKGKCVYKKDTGKKVGCTKGSVKKYLAALHINAKESTLPSFKDYQKATYKETFLNTIAGDQRVTDTQHSNIGETQYSDGQDYSVPASPVFDATNREQVIQDVINDLEDLKTQHDWDTAVNDDLIRAMADTLREIGIEPTDLDASVGASPDKQEQYMIYGPSSWKGGNGALNDLKAILAGREPQEIKEDESVPSSDLPYGSADSNPGMADLSENFKDGKNPGRKGLSKRVGIPKKPSLSTLAKIAKNSTGERRKMAQWQLNMRRGKKKK
jgi:hypothetical protein